MKKLLVNAILLFAIVSTSFAQLTDTVKSMRSREGELDALIVQTNMLAKNFYGFNWGIKYFPWKHVATGAHILYSQKSLADTFNYAIKKPVIQYMEFGWINQYDFIETTMFQLDFYLVNGIIMARLGDNAIKEKLHKNQPKEIAVNYFYLLEPGASFCYNLTKKPQDKNLWLTVALNYRFDFGHSNYAAAQQFQNPLFGVGISIM